MWPLRSASESALIAGPSAKADVIVSEILDATLIGEGVLHTMRDATVSRLASNRRLGIHYTLDTIAHPSGPRKPPPAHTSE